MKVYNKWKKKQIHCFHVVLWKIIKGRSLKKFFFSLLMHLLISFIRLLKPPTAPIESTSKVKEKELEQIIYNHVAMYIK